MPRGSAAPSEGLRPLKVAVLGTFTTTPLEPCLRVGALRLGLAVDLWVADFDQLRAQIMDPGSALYRHDPEVVILATTWRDLRADTPAEVQAAEWADLWSVCASGPGQVRRTRRKDGPAPCHIDSSDTRSLVVSRARERSDGSERTSRVKHVIREGGPGSEPKTDRSRSVLGQEAFTARGPWLVEEYLAVFRR